MKKKFFAMFLVATMLATLTACGGTSNEAVVEEPTEAEETVEENSENSEAVLESTSTASNEAVEEPVVEENGEAVTEENNEVVSEEPVAPAYTYTDLSATMYAQQTVNVRTQPSTGGEKVGSLKTNDEVTVTGQCNETSWYRISYNGSEAYVSNNYLGDNKVEVQQPAQNTQTSDNSGGGSNKSSNPCPYTLWEPVDNGDSFSWYVVQPCDSEHENKAKWIMNTLGERALEWFEENGGACHTDQTTWEFIGTYDEGNVYYQVLSIVYD